MLLKVYHKYHAGAYETQQRFPPWKLALRSAKSGCRLPTGVLLGGFPLSAFHRNIPASRWAFFVFSSKLLFIGNRLHMTVTYLIIYSSSFVNISVGVASKGIVPP